jgi:cyclohexa-1,5-dienecarbonyl-CoA hydratase
MPDPVTSARSPGGDILTLSFHHPKGNILTAQVVSALRAAVSDAPRPALKLVLLEGVGPDFSFGASVPEHAPGEIARVLPDFHRLVSEVLQVPAATGAVVRGRCLGGGFELALACDFIFAAEDACLGLPEIGLGVFPPVGSILLPLRVGLARATSSVLRGDPRPAGDWHAAGLVELLAPTPELAGAVWRWHAHHLAPKSSSAIRFACRAVRQSARELVARVLPTIEQLYLTELMRTHDATEGVAAFMQKRAPRWTGD